MKMLLGHTEIYSRGACVCLLHTVISDVYWLPGGFRICNSTIVSISASVLGWTVREESGVGQSCRTFHVFEHNRVKTGRHTASPGPQLSKVVQRCLMQHFWVQCLHFHSSSFCLNFSPVSFIVPYCQTVTVFPVTALLLWQRHFSFFHAPSPFLPRSIHPIISYSVHTLVRQR